MARLLRQRATISEGVSQTELDARVSAATTAAQGVGTGNTPQFAGLNLDGTALTSNATELNLLDNVSGLVQADLTKLAAVDATAAELNIMDGVTSTAAELNIVDGVTSTAAELNLLDGSSVTNATVSKAVVLDSSGNIALPNTKGISFAATADGPVSTASELLDDYEEGSWTPTGTSMTTMNGTYLKIGKHVTCWGYMTKSGTATRTAWGGLPYTCATASGGMTGGGGVVYNTQHNSALVMVSHASTNWSMVNRQANLNFDDAPFSEIAFWVNYRVA